MCVDGESIRQGSAPLPCPFQNGLRPNGSFRIVFSKASVSPSRCGLGWWYTVCACVLLTFGHPLRSNPSPRQVLPTRDRVRRRIGKTVKFRRGAAAVIGQVPGRNVPLPTRREGRPGAATSREPEDLPVELLFRCFGHEHPDGPLADRLQRAVRLGAEASYPLARPGRKRCARDSPPSPYSYLSALR